MSIWSSQFTKRSAYHDGEGERGAEAVIDLATSSMARDGNIRLVIWGADSPAGDVELALTPTEARRIGLALQRAAGDTTIGPDRGDWTP